LPLTTITYDSCKWAAHQQQNQHQENGCHHSCTNMKLWDVSSNNIGWNASPSSFCVWQQKGASLQSQMQAYPPSTVEMALAMGRCICGMPGLTGGSSAGHNEPKIPSAGHDIPAKVAKLMSPKRIVGPMSLTLLT
jgi:hypothetical protein